VPRIKPLQQALSVPDRGTGSGLVSLLAEAS